MLFCDSSGNNGSAFVLRAFELYTWSYVTQNYLFISNAKERKEMHLANKTEASQGYVDVSKYLKRMLKIHNHYNLLENMLCCFLIR